MMKRSTIALAIEARDLHKTQSWTRVAKRLGKDRSYLISIVRQLNQLSPADIEAKVEQRGIKGPPTFTDGTPMGKIRGGAYDRYPESNGIQPDAEWFAPPNEVSNGGTGWQIRYQRGETELHESIRGKDLAAYLPHLEGSLRGGPETA